MNDNGCCNDDVPRAQLTYMSSSPHETLEATKMLGVIEDVFQGGIPHERQLFGMSQQEGLTKDISTQVGIPKT